MVSTPYAPDGLIDKIEKEPEETCIYKTNGVIITDAIRFVQTSKEKLVMSKEGEKKSNDPNYNKDQLEEEQEENAGEKDTTNQVF